MGKKEPGMDEDKFKELVVYFKNCADISSNAIKDFYKIQKENLKILFKEK